MLKNSREILDKYLPALTASRRLSLAKCRPGDFAIYRFGGASVAVAALSVLRAHGVRRFDGFIGVASSQTVGPASRGRMEFGEVIGLHIFNVKPLLSSAFIDEADVCGSVENFLDAVAHEFDRLLGGRLPEKTGETPIKLTLTPVVAE